MARNHWNAGFTPYVDICGLSRTYHNHSQSMDLGLFPNVSLSVPGNTNGFCSYFTNRVDRLFSPQISAAKASTLIRLGVRQFLLPQKPKCCGRNVSPSSVNEEPMFLIFLRSYHCSGQCYFPWEPIVFSVSVLLSCLQHVTLYLMTKLLHPVPCTYNTVEGNKGIGVSPNREISERELLHHKIIFEEQTICTQSETQQSVHSCNAVAAQYCRDGLQISPAYSAERFSHLKDKCNQITGTSGCPAWLHSNWTKTDFFSSFMRRRKLPKVIFSSRTWNPFFKKWILLLTLISTSFPGVGGTETTDSGTVFTTGPAPKTAQAVNDFDCPAAKLFCDQYSLKSLLDDGDLQQCCGTGQFNATTVGWCEAIDSVIERDKFSRREYDAFIEVILKYATADKYSVQWSMEQCKVAYKQWMCSMELPYYEENEGGKRLQIPACPSLCNNVEKSCPFFRVHNFTKLYGGQPIFLCHGFQDSALPMDTDLCHVVSDMPRAIHGHHQQFSTVESQDKTWTLSAETYVTIGNTTAVKREALLPLTGQDIKLEKYPKPTSKSPPKPCSQISTGIGFITCIFISWFTLTSHDI